MTNPNQAPTAGSTPTPWVVDSDGCIRQGGPGNTHRFISLASPWCEGAFAYDPVAIANAELIVAAVNAYTPPKSAGSSTPSEEQMEWARETIASFPGHPNRSIGLLARRLAEREAASAAKLKAAEYAANFNYEGWQQELSRSALSPLAVVAFQEVLRRLEAELAQLVSYRKNDCLGDAESKKHAFTIASGRIDQITLDIAELRAALSTPAGEGK